MHWISYSNADQALLRAPDLEHTWDALVVPGTLAVFYFQGTGGFVLTRGRPYVIDPRTPLLQTIEVSRPEPKKSHLALAEIHDPEVPFVWPDREIPISHWQDGRWPRVVQRVMDFQDDYSGSATEKIDKYAQLLAEATGRPLAPAFNLDPPHRIVPPYWAVTGSLDPWWELSRDAIEIALDQYEPARVSPIVAMTRETPIARFAELLGELPDDCRAVFCWRGSWDEAQATEADIESWVHVARLGNEYDVAVTNLYGGYLSVLLTGLGLAGVNHGIGYSEQRDVRRLGETGAPPARYYVPALRSFVSRASAQPVLDSLPASWACPCPVCARVSVEGIPVVDSLSTEDLKRHFLICRDDELRRVAEDLNTELYDLEGVAGWLVDEAPRGIGGAAVGKRLEMWASTVRRLS